MTDGQIGRHLIKTGDGVRWDDPAIDADEMNEMLWELWQSGSVHHSPKTTKSILYWQSQKQTTPNA